MKTKRAKFSPGGVNTMGGLDHYGQMKKPRQGPMPSASPDMNLPKPVWKSRRKKKVNKEPAQWVSGTQIPYS